MSNGFRRTLIAGGPILALLLTGCGVKNLPTAPQSGETPSAVVQPEQASDSEIIGAGRRDTVEAVAAPRITAIGEDRDDQVSAAEVTRTPGASSRSFFLDPLLN